ncbi:aminoglycoside phosphotransferase family protein [Streptomyces sp. NBC_01198]|uniref:aminoglycoside phosphotransferase family protein n=1 Tax=Streptomyces sp. NBC_01198 TaxID=2903769 RepID=UPI002E14FADB|nr:aminoglycoside phosphotransferase family protein [Streptomyces sp. NBC_01198]
MLADRAGLPRGSRVTMRVRRPADETLAVTLRTWEHEAQVLAAVRPWLANVPQPLVRDRDYGVLTYAAGTTLADVSPAGKPLDRIHLEQLGGVFGALLRVPVAQLPARPAHWPADGDSAGFLRMLLAFAEQVRLDHDAEFGLLFRRMGVPQDALTRLAGTAAPLTPRPFALLHTDLHRRNIVVRDDRTLHVIDWELSSFGDPAYELATHLCRTDYPEWQWDEAVEVWRAAATAVSPAFAAALDADLPAYVRYERAQSVYPDVMRAARALVSPRAPLRMTEAVRRARLALHRAAPALGMTAVPDRADVTAALNDWLRALPA